MPNSHTIAQLNRALDQTVNLRDRRAKVIGVRMPSSAQLLAYAPGCGSPTPVIGTGGVAPCGATVSGRLHLCHYCQPKQEGQAKDFLRAVKRRLDEPQVVSPHSPSCGELLGWRMGPVPFAARLLDGDLYLYGVRVHFSHNAERIIRAMIQKLKPRTVTVNSGFWLDAARVVFSEAGWFKAPVVRGDAYTFKVPKILKEGQAKDFLKKVSDEPRPVKDWVPGTSYDYPWEWLGQRYGVQFQNRKLHIGGGGIELTTAGHILRRMVKKLRPERVSVNPGVWLDAANRLLPLASVSGACYTFDVPRWMLEGAAKAFLRSVKPAEITGTMKVTVGGRHPSFTNVRAIWYRDLLRVGTNKHPGLTLERGNPPPHHVTPEDWERMLDLVEKHVNEDGETAGEYEEMNPEAWTGHSTLPYVAWEYNGGPDKFDYDYQHAALAPSCE